MIYLILVVGLFLRLVSINQSLWLDEATTALVVRMPIMDIFTKFLPNDFHPPLYYLIIKYWVYVFGSSEISLRIPSVIFGVLTIFIIYKISKNYIAPLLVATSGLLIYYSQEARMYSLVALLVILALYLFINKKWIWFSIILCLLGMTDYVSLFILPVFFVFGYKNKKFWLSLLPLFGMFLVWSPIFISQLDGGMLIFGSSWWKILGVLNIKNLALIPTKFILGRISFENKYLYSLIIGTAISIFGYLLFKAKRSLSLIWVWLVLPIFIGIIISFKIPTLSYFRFLFCLPALYILVADGLERVGRYKKILLFSIILINIASSFYYLATYRFHREDWRAAAVAIGDDKIILPSNSQKEALIYYGKGNQTIYYQNFNGGIKEVWLSRYVWQIFDPNDFARRNLENLGYNKVLTTDFNGVVFFKYANRN